MKDEEMAEEYLQSIEGDDCVIITDREERKQAFLAGLKAGRPQWHDLRKDPNDLPEREKEVRIAYHPFLPILQDENEFEECNGIYKKDEPLWLIDNHIYPTEEVIAWCEIPTFDKE